MSTIRLPRSKFASDYQNVLRPVAVLADHYRSARTDAWHSHRRAQLLCACTGVMSVLTEKQGFVVPPLRALWLPGGMRHEVHYCGRVSLRTLYIEQQACDQVPAECRLIEVSDFLRALIVEASSLPIEYNIDGRDGRIMALLLQEIMAMPMAPLRAPMPSDERLGRVCQALFRNPAQDSTLEEWARIAGMSRCTMVRLFQRETGMSFAAWRQHVRLLKALSQLAVGHPVSSVALDVGYHSPSAFTAVFHRSFGTTPSRYFSASRTNRAPARSHQPLRAT